MGNSEIIIREVRQADFNEWLPLWEGYNVLYKRNIPADVTKVTWGRFLNLNEPVHALVATMNERIVGIVHYLFHRNTSMINDVCYLQDLFTKSEARNSGIGRKLILAVYEKAREKQSPRVYWQTQHDNKIAKCLYEKVAEYSGFEVYRKPFPEFTESKF